MRTRTVFVLLMVVLVFDCVYARDVNVRGYYRRDGTYVRPHVRSSPDHYRWNNYGPSRSDAELMNGALRDSDGDGVPNSRDFDDDNDGIPDDRDSSQYGSSQSAPAITNRTSSVPPSTQSCYPGYQEVAGVCTKTTTGDSAPAFAGNGTTPDDRDSSHQKPSTLSPKITNRTNFAPPSPQSCYPGYRDVAGICTKDKNDESRPVVMTRTTQNISDSGCAHGQVRFHGRCTSVEGGASGTAASDRSNFALAPSSRTDGHGVCRTNEVLFNGQCTRIESEGDSYSQNKSLARSSPECSHDHHWDGVRCSYGPPPNGTQNILNSAWTCDFGYQRRGSTCVAITLPPNAHFRFSGRSWKCNSGYERQGNACVRASSASESRIGTTETCPPGTRRIGLRCRRS